MIVSPVIAADPVAAKVAERVLAASQLIEHLSHYQDAYQSNANKSLFTGDGTESRIQLAFKESFDINVIRQSLLEFLTSKYDQQTLRRLAEFLELPLIATMIREERRIEEPDTMEERCRYIDEIRNNPQPEKRTGLLNEIEAVLHGAENEVDTTILMSEGMSVSLEPFITKEASRRLGDALRTMKENRDVLIADSRRDLMLNYHFIYRSADDAQLNEYINLLHTEIGQKYVAFVSGAVPIALVKSQRRAAEKIAEILRQQKETQCVEPASAFDKGKPVATITNYGIMTNPTKQTGLLEASMPGETVKVLDISDMSFLSTSARIPAKLGLRFGVAYRIDNLPNTQSVNLRTRVLHPPMTGRDGSIRTELQYSRDFEVSNGSAFGGDFYEFEEDFELLPGDWTIILYYEDIKLLEKDFQVYKEGKGQ